MLLNSLTPDFVKSSCAGRRLPAATWLTCNCLSQGMQLPFLLSPSPARQLEVDSLPALGFSFYVLISAPQGSIGISILKLFY